MLVISRHVISRHAEQQMLIPHAGIAASILQVRGRLVKLRIDAPRCRGSVPAGTRFFHSAKASFRISSRTLR